VQLVVLLYARNGCRGEAKLFRRSGDHRPTVQGGQKIEVIGPLRLTRVGDSSQRLETRVRLESVFLRLATYLRLALKDLRLDLRLELKDLRLTRESTLKTQDFLVPSKSLCYESS